MITYALLVTVLVAQGVMAWFLYRLRKYRAVLFVQAVEAAKSAPAQGAGGYV